jgi:uncharacterized phage-associated protein
MNALKDFSNTTTLSSVSIANEVLDYAYHHDGTMPDTMKLNLMVYFTACFMAHHGKRLLPYEEVVLGYEPEYPAIFSRFPNRGKSITEHPDTPLFTVDKEEEELDRTISHIWDAFGNVPTLILRRITHLTNSAVEQAHEQGLDIVPIELMAKDETYIPLIVDMR